MDKDNKITIGNLYPDLSHEQKAQAAETIRKYIEVLKGICDDLEAAGELDNFFLRVQWEKRNRNQRR